MDVTETKTIKVDTDCKQNPVFISWLNTYGGREHWLFHKVQINGLVTINGQEFEKDITDLENATSKTEILSKDAVPQLIVNAYVDIEDLEGIKTMLYSPCVEMLMNIDTWEVEGPKWLRVEPSPGSFPLYNSLQSKALIEITFNLPYINIQSQ
jgi:hypothetical protein